MNHFGGKSSRNLKLIPHFELLNKLTLCGLSFPCLLYAFLRSKDCRNVELTTYLHLVTGLRLCGSLLSCPLCALHGVLLAKRQVYFAFPLYLNVCWEAAYRGTHKKLPHVFSLATARYRVGCYGGLIQAGGTSGHCPQVHPLWQIVYSVREL